MWHWHFHQLTVIKYWKHTCIFQVIFFRWGNKFITQTKYTVFKYTSTQLHSEFKFNSVISFSLWGLRPQTPTRGSAPGLRWGTQVPETPSAFGPPILTTDWRPCILQQFLISIYVNKFGSKYHLHVPSHLNSVSALSAEIGPVENRNETRRESRDP